jgi:hypothetical protein
MLKVFAMWPYLPKVRLRFSNSIKANNMPPIR